MTQPSYSSRKETPMSKNSKLSVNSFLAVLLLLAVVLGCGRMRKTQPTPSNEGNAPLRERTAPGEIAAEDLFAEYQKDKNAADTRYKGKVITVKGTVDTMKTETGNPYITMKTSSLILRVQCIFPKGDASTVSGLTKGQTVRVRGKVFGRIGNVVLQDCELL
jgi:hypothetical protein